jgi:hypothetical protein
MPLPVEFVQDAQAAPSHHRDQRVDTLRLELVEHLTGEIGCLGHPVVVDSPHVEGVDAGGVAEESRARRIDVLEESRVERDESAVGVAVRIH